LIYIFIDFNYNTCILVKLLHIFLTDFFSLIPYDHDADIAILHKDTAKLELATNWTSNLTKSNYYYLRIQPYWKRLPPSTRNLTALATFKEPNARF
jgi:hypothetical protein